MQRFQKLKHGILFCFSMFGILTQGVLAMDPESQPKIDRVQSENAIQGKGYLGWESRYYSEGRDALDGDSLLMGSLEASWKQLTAGIWYGNSPNQRYDELHLNLEVSQSVADFELAVGYRHLRFPFEDAHDNEIGVGVSWSGLPLEIELSAEVYYSFDAEGYFAEIAASRSFLLTEALAFHVSTPLGINQGYVDDGHDGFNHIALRFELEYALTESLALGAHATYSWALNREEAFAGDEQLIDYFHGGVGLSWAF